MGVLWPAAGRDVFDTGQLPLPEPLSLVASHYWWVTWRRDPAVPFRQQVLSHPVVHLTVEDAADGRIHGFTTPVCLLHGVVTDVFTVDLPVAGRVAGVAFQPGGLAALLDIDVRGLTDTVVHAEEVLGPEVRALSELVLAESEEGKRRDHVAAYLSGLLEPRLEAVRADGAYRLVREAVRLMRTHEHTTVASVADRLHVSPRHLQRVFARYVGLSPLRVLRRYRLREAAATLDAGAGSDLATAAAELGYSDQAHFTRDFARVVGVPPARYRRGHLRSAMIDDAAGAVPEG